ncbi:MAG: aldo/keto reductase, partial [Spirochaetia bacterium]|nr:aldo/keto reductase [Spirochaetia bacterium]
MDFRLLGKSGLRVSELCLGTMTFGEEWGWGAPKEESRKIFDAYAEAGGNFIDTANRYTNGTSESFVGEFVGKERDRFVIATKYTLNMRQGDPNAGGNHRKNMKQSIEASLHRLGTDYVDLYWVHAADGITPLEEVMRALDDLVREGKILYAGISDMPAWSVSRANTIAEFRGWSPFVGLQIKYSLNDRDVEREYLPMSRALDMAVLAWGPLAAGLLSGKFNEGKPDADARLVKNKSKLLTNERSMAIARETQAVAKEIGRTSAQVAINWLSTRNGVVIPILGASKLSQIQDNLKSLDFTLSAEHLKRLDDVSKIDLGFPHDFLAGPRM